MNRFFVEESNVLQAEGIIIINNQEDIKHISKVLRLKIDEEIEICDGKNREYICRIMDIKKDKVSSVILESKHSLTESFVEVTLFQGIPKSTKMELIIQKCTELGIKRIVPIITNRTVVQLKDKKNEEKKLQRWQKIAEESAKQCKRGVVPKISTPMTFNEMLENIDEYDLKIIPYEEEEKWGLKNILSNKIEAKRVAIVIGPEGGFEKEEIDNSIKHGLIPVSLGPRTLRTETAGIIALSIVMYELGDLGGS